MSRTKWRKHEWRGNGWRQHVPYLVGVRDPSRPLGIRGEMRCSEPDCEMNRRRDES